MDTARASELLQELMGKYSLFSRGWTFRFDSAKKRLGCCNHRRRVISLSRHYVALNREELVRDTILHEIAHALVGPGHWHDWTWKAKAREIGARPIACKDVLTDGLVQIKTDWMGKCSDCGAQLSRVRKPNFNGAPYWHPACRRKANRGIIVWSFKGTSLDDWGQPINRAMELAADTPKPEAKITQSEINELWARLD